MINIINIIINLILSNNYMKLKIVKSHLANKKLDAIFTYDDGKTKYL